MNELVLAFLSGALFTAAAVFAYLSKSRRAMYHNVRERDRVVRDRRHPLT